MIARYLTELLETLGTAWNRFWFTPREASTLAVLRFVVGLLATYTLLTYTPDLVDWFKADGLITVDTVTEYRDFNRFSFSYLDYLPTPGELLGVHFIGIAVTLLFAVGLWTRVTSILSLVIMLSYMHRAPMLVGQYEPILMLLMVYLCLAPTGSVFSVDHWLANRRKKAPSMEVAVGATANRGSVMATIATRLIQVHFAAAVAMMVLAKLRGEVWWTGDAIWWLSARSELRLIDVSGALSTNEIVYEAWTHLVVAFELLFPVLVWNRLARPLLLVCGAVLWMSLGVLSGNLMFGVVLVVASWAYITPDAMRRIVGGLKATTPEVTETAAVAG